MNNYLNWLIDYSRVNEGIYELRSEGGYYSFYIKSYEQVKEVKKAIEVNFMLSEESKQKAYELLDSLQF